MPHFGHWCARRVRCTRENEGGRGSATKSKLSKIFQLRGCSRWHAPSTDHQHHQHHQQYQRALDGPVAVATAPAVVVVVPQAQPPRNILDGARQRSTAAVAAAQKAKSSGGGAKSGGGSGSGCAGYCDGKKSFLGIHLSKEQKASTTLGIIMSAFVICWLPFFILALVRIFLDDPSLIPDELSSACIWLGYCNSLLNPIIYVTLNRDFRKPFRAILCFRCGDLRNMTREEFYKNHYGKTAMMSYGRSAATADIDTDKGYAAARNARVNAALNQQQLVSSETSRFTPRSTTMTTTTTTTTATASSSTVAGGRGTTSVTVDVEPSPQKSSAGSTVTATGRVQESSV
ncbi:unnamed protein product [Trichogramma brassicae]|uniref:G-protein coupled receptors family 1 profile domain-containing protein n=1 Tax=Trichogramma brassicae TaxID=86971 RepID=A0A6H5J7X3_9HYME|nr:unnamed protein product [Trichogramma brassicae]